MNGWHLDYANGVFTAKITPEKMAQIMAHTTKLAEELISLEEAIVMKNLSWDALTKLSNQCALELIKRSSEDYKNG